MAQYRTVDPEWLKIINADSLKRGYNSTIPEEIIDVLDDIPGVITFSMIHEKAGGIKVEDHVRTVILCKTNDSLEPVEVILDMSIENFNEHTREVENLDDLQ